MPRGLRGFQKGHKINNRRKKSEEWKKWLSYFNKKIGRKPPNRKGVALSIEHKKKLSEAKKKNPPWLGKKMSIETRKKMSEAKGGNKSHFWKGGITPINAKLRNSLEFRLWREAVFARDNWTCQKTGIRGCEIVAHHIKNFADYPELRFVIDNGITLSKEVHDEFHKIYGKKKNTKGQIDEFIIKQGLI
jgi:hypothetical protein